MNTARAYNFATAGDKTAALNFGGNEPPGAVSGKTELWNGAAWTEVNDLNDTRGGNAGCGTTTSALSTGGSSPGDTANTETWNGTSWTEVNNLNTARDRLAAAGADNEAALAFGGGPSALTESWDGTSWTEVNDLNTARNQLGGAGIQTAALGFGGSPGPTAATEQWNGSSVGQKLPI